MSKSDAPTTDRPAAKRRAPRQSPPGASGRGPTKHERAAEMLRELRSSAEALSANADRLLARFS